MRVGAILLAAWLWLAPVAFAHGGPSRLELSVEQINPGGTLEVRGINLASEQFIAITLSGVDAVIPLGTVVGDAHGDFTQAFVLPMELAEGVYIVRASISTGPVAEVALTVSGPAIAVEGEGEQRAEEEPLLAPIPTSPRVVATPLGQPVAPAAASTLSSRPGAWWPLAFGAVLAAALGLAVVVRRKTMSAR